MFNFPPTRSLAVTAVLLLVASSTVRSQSNGNYCGSTWIDAVSRCAKPCPTGAPTECFGGEICFAGTPCKEAVPETPPPVPSAHTQLNVGTCGNGQVGNAVCPDNAQCCSFYGYCGTSPVHCDNQAVPPQPSPSSGGTAPSIFGTCGGGNVGNGICTDNNECCSMYGFCGTSVEHCANKVGNFGPDYSVTQQTTSQYSVTQQSTPQGLVPVASPMDSYPVPQSMNNYPVTQSTENYPAAQPMENYPTMATTQQTVLDQTEADIKGTCGSGSIGNGICATTNECCSAYGFCGTALEYCITKDGSAGTNYSPVGQQQSPQNSVLTEPPYEYSSPAAQQYPSQAPPPSSSLVTNPTSPVIPQSDLSKQHSYPQMHLYEPVSPHGTSKKIIGYYAGWQWYDRDKLADPKNIDFRKVNRVNYAFFQPDVQGNIYGTDRWADSQLLFGPYSEKLMGGIQKCSYDGPNEINCAYHEHNKGIINMAHEAGAEIYPSIGGWTLSDNFPTLSANPTSRDHFAKKCAEIVEYYGFDGIDIDWEYPGYADHSGTPADTINFTKMLAAIRAALDMLTISTGKQYGLTAALPCNPDHIANIEVSHLVNILTEWNLMSYDFFGAWDDVTGVNSPLYPQGFGNDEFCIDRCVKNYADLGVPKEKINIGLPFYGRSFKNATGLNQRNGGNDVTSWPVDEGTPQYFNIYAKLPNMIQVRDNKSKTQYAYTSHLEQSSLVLPEGLVSFDDERAICDKVHYAQKYSMGGFIIWELSGDLLPDLRTPLLDIVNKKLGNPAFECCLLHSQQECEIEKAEEQNNATATSWEGFDGNNWLNQHNNYFQQSNNCKSSQPANTSRFIALLVVMMQIFR